MLTSKVGILMRKTNMAKKTGLMVRRVVQTRAFTFVEVMVALVIVSISLVALIRLHIISINMTDTAEATSQAMFLAEEKIEEMLAHGYPKKGTSSGTVEKKGLAFSWQTMVTELRPPQLAKADVTGLREILVDVSWRQGTGRKRLQMSTYIADRQIP
jgi:type II secretion system protein I